MRIADRGRGLNVARAPEVQSAIEAVQEAAGRRRGRGQGFRISAADRKAIEDHAMEVANAYFSKAGWTVIDVSANRSYDLHCTKDDETLCSEVKGATTDGASVLLTPNEVRTAPTTRKLPVALETVALPLCYH